ncbi:MAG: hypothetical protein EOM02_06430, partial [Synergistales bacterium]|nr:hypothetical protein [Synergistales bacterium]
SINKSNLKEFEALGFESLSIYDTINFFINKIGLCLKESDQETLDKAKSREIDETSFVKKKLISAEVQSTLGYINKSKKPMSLELYMYPSKGSISFLTAIYSLWYLKEVYDAHFFSNWVGFSGFICPLDINVGGPQGFHESVNEMFSCFDVRRKNLGADSSLVINMTGGYKSMSAYASLYSLIYDIPSIYSFEDSTEGETFELMPLPISCAIGAMDEEISLLKGLKDLDDLSRGEILGDQTIPRWVKGLFVNGKPSFLVNSLIEQYEKGRNQVTGSGKELLRRLKDLEPSLGLYIEKLIETSWSELWMGDQIPETVEHSRRHSKRLMEIAGNFLRALDQRPCGVTDIFMDKPIPLALLISAIYLHDIGHTALVYPIDPDKAKDVGAFPLSMFPSAVREVHHLLSSEMILYRTEKTDKGEAATRGPLFPEAFSVLDKHDNVDWGRLESQIEILKKLLSDICSGHRNYVRLNEDVEFKKKKAVWQVGKFLMGKERFEETLVPLKVKFDKHYEAFFEENRKTITSDMTLTVTALLRVIDGCDVQSDRIVSDDYLIQRLQRTAYEARTLEAQLPMFATVLKEYVAVVDGVPMSINCCIEEISQEARKLTPNAAKDGDMDDIDAKRINKISSSLYPTIFKILRELKGEKSFNSLFEPKNATVVQALSLANRIVFKWEQFLHFYKHRSVEVVLPVPDKSVSIPAVRICLLSGEKGQSRNNLIPIAKDIVEEVERARGTAKDGKNPRDDGRDYLGNILINTDPRALKDDK